MDKLGSGAWHSARDPEPDTNRRSFDGGNDMKTRNGLKWLLPAVLGAFTFAGVAIAAEPPEDVPEVAQGAHDTEGDIALPDDAAPEAREAASYGLEQANAARDDGRAYGEARAAAAADNADAASAAANAATDNPGADRRP